MLEARRMQAEYDAAKRSYDQMAEISKVVLDTWGRIESMQTQEIRSLLEQGLGLISQKTCGLINQTIQKTLLDCGMSLEDMDVGNGTRDASSGKRGVSVLQYPGWAQTLSEWPNHADFGCPVGEWRYQ